MNLKLNCDLVIYGSQGSGKTTQAKILAEMFGAVFFSMGDASRALCQSDPKAKKIMNSGALLPDYYFEQEINKFIDQIQIGGHAVYEGIVRNLDQQKFFVEMMAKRSRLFKVIFIEVSDKEVLARIKKRRESGEQKRDDENDSIVAERLKIFRDKTMPVLEQYEKQDIELIRIDGDVSVDEVTAKILQAL
ncbi:MAG: nucleoside monophosphate kinase [Patescibacteria group bacterium]|nr:nucleoside monophosphate kinase [Patescibacteria group bacterium]